MSATYVPSAIEVLVGGTIMVVSAADDRVVDSASVVAVEH